MRVCLARDRSSGPDRRRRPDRPFAPVGTAAPWSGPGRLAAQLVRGDSGRHLTRAGQSADGAVAQWTWHRRKRLALSRDRRGAILAAVERPGSGRAALRDCTAAGWATRADLPRGQALLVVQPGRGGCP